MQFTAEEIELIICGLAMMAETDEENGFTEVVEKTRQLIARFEQEARSGKKETTLSGRPYYGLGD